MRKSLSVLLTFIFILTMFSATGISAVGTTAGSCGSSATWNWDTGTATLTISGSGEIQSYSLGNFAPWKSFSDDIKHIVINSGITKVGNYAFSMCENVVSASLPEGIKDLGDFSFAWNYSLESVVLPSSLTRIGTEAFVWCESIKSMIIPQNVNFIGDDAFQWCKSISSFRVAEQNKTFFAVDGVLYNFDCTSLIFYPSNKTATAFTVPDGVREIYRNAFAGNTRLNELILSASVTEIDNSAFFECTALQSVGFASNSLLTKIGSSVFYGCKSLKGISVPDGVEIIGDGTFKKCAILKYVYMPDTLKILGKDVFAQSPNTVIIASQGSAARDYAVNSGISFYKCTTVYLDGKEISFGQKPIVVSGVTLVPMREIFEALKAQVSWDGKTQTASAVKGSTKIRFSIGNKIMYKNNTPIELQVPATLLGGKTMVPLRAISEAADVRVEWDDASQAVRMFTE